MNTILFQKLKSLINVTHLLAGQMLCAMMVHAHVSQNIKAILMWAVGPNAFLVQIVHETRRVSETNA